MSKYKLPNGLVFEIHDRAYRTPFTMEDDTMTMVQIKKYIEIKNKNSGMKETYFEGELLPMRFYFTSPLKPERVRLVSVKRDDIKYICGYYLPSEQSNLGVLAEDLHGDDCGSFDNCTEVNNT
jgi:hypothetical protein